MSIQIAVVGPSGVGKSSLIRRLKQQKFNHDFCAPTIGINSIEMNIKVSNKQHKVEIFDCQGVSDNCRLKDIPLYNRCSGFLIITDITSKDSFTRAKQCFQELINDCKPQSQLMIVIGNKIDLKDKRQVDYQEAINYWSQRGVDYIETSAKTSSNIAKVFERLLKAVIVDLQAKKPKQVIVKEVIKIKQVPAKSGGGGGCQC